MRQRGRVRLNEMQLEWPRAGRQALFIDQTFRMPLLKINHLSSLTPPNCESQVSGVFPSPRPG